MIHRPVGVHVIIGSLVNPFRYVLAPLAASIASRNITIVALEAGKENPLLSLLAREWPKYLGVDCNLLVGSLDVSQAIGVVDMISIYGKHMPLWAR